MNSTNNSKNNFNYEDKIILFIIAVLPIFSLLSILIFGNYYVSVIIGWLGVPLAFYDRSQILKKEENAPGIIVAFFYPIYLFKRFKLSGVIWVTAYLIMLISILSGGIVTDDQIEETAKKIINENYNILCTEVDIYNNNGDIYYANALFLNGDILRIVITKENDMIRVNFDN